ncbi:glucosamine-6-phosphate deaminase [Ruminococcus gauvreauii]|uniref:Glucosamine-6-phosphate deaminase n=1 Tax=Ruminococcus gauvreauii TaxID=438033 RepID=A0ABY5VBJ4_9FIRM|nr:glucosamine-6-phosphate deaminase [Ruminococcus gauvreauii]UWP57902.1 glucosamine-6-phosphate deaminase [Ruminococcus gauvreauii]
MNVVVCKNYEEMSQKAAELAAESIRENPSALVSFPGGDTPLGMIQAFTDLVNSGKVDISGAHYVSLDEWVGMSQSDKGSCGCFNRTEFFSRLEKEFADIHIIDGAACNIEEERASLDEYIEKYGPLDVSVLGIGLNGHLGFNEEGVDFNLGAHIIPLAEKTKEVMHKYFGDQHRPEYGITQGIRQIMAAKKVILLANGAHKADIIRKAVCGEVSNAVPASILQNHPNCFVVVDEAAAVYL